jgi:hypothetical protein
MQVITVTKQKTLGIAIPVSIDCSFQKTIGNISCFVF